MEKTCDTCKFGHRPSVLKWPGVIVCVNSGSGKQGKEVAPGHSCAQWEAEVR